MPSKLSINPDKINLLQALSQSIKNMPPELAIPYIAKANSDMAKNNMSFTQEELDYLLEESMKSLSPAQKSQIEIIRTMLINNR